MTISPLLGIQFGPGHVQRDVQLPGVALEFGVEGAIFGFGPGLNRPFVQSLRWIRYHQVQIEVDGVAETLAPRTGAIGIVEGKEPRLRFFVTKIAMLALKTVGEARALRRLVVARNGFKDDLSGLAVANLDGIDDAGAGIRGYHQPVHQQENGLSEVDV